jgi:catechol 2,3-dioxygenase-like lactoylglutathione lyase family enzyme
MGTREDVYERRGQSRMKIIPVLKCRDMKESISFYTRVLGFEPEDPEANLSSPVINLKKGDAEIQLSVLSGDGAFGSAVNVLTAGVDDLFKTFAERGLDTSRMKESPVHQGPIDQSWGMREFYVTDPNGNTLRFGEPIKGRFTDKKE